MLTLLAQLQPSRLYRGVNGMLSHHFGRIARGIFAVLVEEEKKPLGNVSSSRNGSNKKIKREKRKKKIIIAVASQQEACGFDSGLGTFLYADCWHSPKNMRVR